MDVAIAITSYNIQPPTAVTDFACPIPEGINERVQTIGVKGTFVVFATTIRIAFLRHWRHSETCRLLVRG